MKVNEVMRKSCCNLLLKNELTLIIYDFIKLYKSLQTNVAKKTTLVIKERFIHTMGSTPQTKNHINSKLRVYDV